MTALPTIYITLYNHLTHNDLGEGICYGIASSATYSVIHKAFQRCFRASLEGFAMSIGSMTMVVKAIQRIGSMTNVIKVNIYGNQEVKRLTMR